MVNESYKRAWKRCGDLDPYYGVLSDERFRGRHLTPETRNDFFQSGQEHVARVIEKIRAHVDSNFRPNRTLDFGCGVGRLVIPFANISHQVTGIDISDGMLAEAKLNCDLSGLSNVSFATSLEELSGSFDFIHSYIVLQHIPPAIGIQLLDNLLARVAGDGIAALHLTYFNQGSWLRRCVATFRSRFRFLHNILNLLQSRSIREPLLQMNEYELNQVMAAYQRNCFSDLHVFFTQHAKSSGVMLIGKKSHSAYEF